jgi:hypothetical protein
MKKTKGLSRSEKERSEEQREKGGLGGKAKRRQTDVWVSGRGVWVVEQQGGLSPWSQTRTNHKDLGFRIFDSTDFSQRGFLTIVH